MTAESTGYNSGFKKLADQCLQEVRFSKETFVIADSFVHRNRQLLKPAKRNGQVGKDSFAESKISNPSTVLAPFACLHD